MQYVFIDTCIYEEGQFVGSGTLKTLYDAAKEGYIRILLPDITEREVLAHIDAKMNAEKEKLEKHLSSIMKYLEPIRDRLEEIVAQSETAAQEMTDMFLKELKSAKVCRLPLQEDLDFRSIVDAYFNKKPPFSQKKKSEFPDAIVLKSLEQWCKVNKKNCIILSNDNDLLNYDSKYLKVEKKDEYLKTLTRSIQEEKRKEEEIFIICKNAYNNLIVDKSIEKEISNWVQKQLDNEILYCTVLQIEEINDYSIGEINIDFSDDSELIGTYDDCLVHSVHVTVFTDVMVNHPNYDTAYYDGEDKQWYFIDDSEETQMTSELDFEIEFITDQNGDFPELESIHSRKKFSQRELECSMNFKSGWE